jgi:hypothetical protein
MQKVAEDEGFSLSSLYPLLAVAPLALASGAASMGGIGKLLAKLMPTNNPAMLAKALGANKLLPTMVAGGGGQQALQHAINQLRDFAPGRIGMGKAMLPWNWGKMRAAATFDKFKSMPELQTALARGATAPNVVADNAGLWGQLGQIGDVSKMPSAISSLFGPVGKSVASGAARSSVPRGVNLNAVKSMLSGQSLPRGATSMINTAYRAGRKLNANEIRTLAGQFGISDWNNVKAWLQQAKLM